MKVYLLMRDHKNTYWTGSPKLVAVYDDKAIAKSEARNRTNNRSVFEYFVVTKTVVSVKSA